MKIQVEAWSTLKQFAICLVVAVLMLVLGYSVDISLLQRKLKSLQKQAIAIEEVMRNKRRIIQQNNFFGTSSNKFTEMVPINLVNGAEILTNLEKSLSEAQVEPSLFEPQVVRENEWLMVYPVTLEINGEYLNLLKFINSLLKQSYLVVVEDVIIQKKAVNSNLNMRILFAVYQAKKRQMSLSKQVNASIRMMERDIFKKPDVEMNLFCWASKELVFLGVIKYGRKTFGIVSDPMGRVYEVTIGDRIGLGQSKIIAIDDSGVMVANGIDHVVRRG